jgi:hypothetical protein
MLAIGDIAAQTAFPIRFLIIIAVGMLPLGPPPLITATAMRWNITPRPCIVVTLASTAENSRLDTVAEKTIRLPDEHWLFFIFPFP